MNTDFSIAIQNWLDVTYPTAKGKFRVVSDTKAYRYKEDEGVWGQHKGIVPESADIYMEVSDDRWEYVADVRTTDNKPMTEVKVNTGLEKIKAALEKEGLEVIGG